jgi:hypothetical protein
MESRKQLEELGFGYLLEQPDWGIVKPRHVSKQSDKARKAKTKNARSGVMPSGSNEIHNPEKDPPPKSKKI